MNAIKKLLALIMCLAVVCSILVSCGEKTPINGEQNIGDTSNDVENNQNDGKEDNTETEPSSDKYVANVKIVYATTDWKMKDAIDKIGTPTTTISVDGENIKIVSSTELDDMYSSTEYVCIDNKLYYSVTVGIGELFASDYKVADVDESSKYQVLYKAGLGANITIDDFASVETSSSGKRTSYTCTDINRDSRNSLSSIFASKFSSLDATLEVVNATYYFETINNRIDNSILSCDFVIVMDGQEYTLTAHIYYTYDYDATVEITAPSDEYKFTEVSLGEII